jgi:hypothetical protein
LCWNDNYGCEKWLDNELIAINWKENSYPSLMKKISIVVGKGKWVCLK